MNGDFFSQLEAELGSLTHAGMHLDQTGGQTRRRLMMLIRRAIATVVLATALAASLSSEFPATANGHDVTARMWAVQSW
jgi:hypothetical protein